MSRWHFSTSLVCGMGSGSFFRPMYVALEENEAAENMPDPLVLCEIRVHPVNGYRASIEETST